MSKTLVWGTLAALCLAACDQVRLPSADISLADETIEVAAEPEGRAAEPAGESEEELVAVQAVVADSAIANDGLQVYDERSDIPSLPPLVEDLAEVNAVPCGLPVKPLDDSPTLAERTGARPADPDLFGTATINGAAASLMDFPGLVKMEPRAFLPSGAIASGHCSATRIAERWFVTAAHCLDDDFDEVVLIAGSETLSSPLATRVNASASLCHASYDGAGSHFNNDIALVRVEEDALAGLSRVPVVKFGTTDKPLVPYNYGEARMAGWGLTVFQGRLSDTLLSAALTISGTGPAEISVVSQDGAGPCVGDSGGPLLVMEEDGSSVVVGVLSVVEQNLETGAFCDGMYGARYTNLRGYEDWIEKVFSTCENGLGLCGF
ncbi:MAG: trypsin-like serine protease [Hyphomonadaceae bacterium]|nr:trypsin-like serine protease [Hyphomonadaceae bacterium]